MNQSLQLCQVFSRQLGNGFYVMNVTVVFPIYLQLATNHAANELQLVAALSDARSQWTRSFRRGVKQVCFRQFAQRLFAASEIVETDLRPRLCSQLPACFFIRTQITQHAITNATMLHAPQ